MKIRTLGSASIAISGATTVLTALALGLLGVDPKWAVAVCTSIFASTFFLSNYVMRKFVVYKIKPIYQVALSKNIKTQDLERELAHKHNMMEDIEGQLTVWAESNKKEITRLKENEKYRKEFLGNVSHEIKTPIFNIQGYILTLLDGALEDETINRKYLERAEKSIDRLINIVTDLEEISRLESGVLFLEKEKFDIVALARDIVEATEMEASRRSIEITVRNPHNVPIMVYADRRYVGQVFVNLIINSIKYGREHGKTKISFIDLFDKIMVEVADDGVGIAKEDIPRVFERFYRTDKSRSRDQGGTGLGLSIVKHIIEAHNESITLRSELSRGSTFSFTLSKNENKPS